MKPRQKKGRQEKREEKGDNIRQGSKERKEESRRRTYLVSRRAAVETCFVRDLLSRRAAKGRRGGWGGEEGISEAMQGKQQQERTPNIRHKKREALRRETRQPTRSKDKRRKHRR